MIVVDTNVFSEPMRPKGNADVLEWLDAQVPETLYLTATSLAELQYGVEILPKGRRKSELASGLNRLVDELFGPRILSFDRDAAVAYAAIVSRAKSRGHTISIADGQIASIAKVHGFTVATRDTSPFLAAGVSVVNPWKTTH